MGRNTQGVRVIKTKAGENLVGVQRIEEPDPELGQDSETEEGSSD